jgi:DNA polymerase-3 subunit alpha
MINRVKKSVTKNGRSAGMPMAMITIEDLEGQIDGVVFAETFAEINKKYPGLVELEQTAFFRGRIDRRRELPSIVVNEIFPVPEAVAKLTQLVIVKLRDPKISPETITELKPHLQKHRGNCECYLQVSHADKIVLLKLGRNHFVRPSTDLVNDLELFLGSGSVELRGSGSRRTKSPPAEQPRMFDEGTPPGDDDGQVVPGEMPPEELLDDEL